MNGPSYGSTEVASSQSGQDPQSVLVNGVGASEALTSSAASRAHNAQTRMHSTYRAINLQHSNNPYKPQPLQQLECRFHL